MGRRAGRPMVILPYMVAWRRQESKQRVIFRIGVWTLVATLAACGATTNRGQKPAELTMRIPVTDPREVPLNRTDPAIDGNLRLTPLAVECGITYLIGTHAEIDYKGQLCRLRLTVENVDNTFHRFDTSTQRLIDRTGNAIAPDSQAMDIKRQDQQPLIGAGDAVVISIYFALDLHRTPKTIVLHGDDDPSGIGTTITAKHHPQGVTITIPQRALYTPKPIF